MAGLRSALRARCPRCGGKGIWASFGQTVERCPSCGYRFSREEGYWTGALIFNIAFAILIFFAVFVGGMLVTWPDVPWTWLLVITVVAMLAAPTILYRQSKTLWVWLDLKFRFNPDQE